MSDEERILRASVVLQAEIRPVLDDPSRSWLLTLPRARETISTFDATRFMHDPARLREQISTVDLLQRLAFKESERGPVADLADWCMCSWLILLQQHPDNVDVLAGLGRNWWFKAQPALSRIHQAEARSSSSGDSAGGPSISTASTDDRPGTRDAESNIQAEARLGMPDYVEARGLLLPATEFFERAIRASESQDNVSGDVLTYAAEALISLGTVTHPRANEQYFRQALVYLRQAGNLPNYILDSNMQQYFESYARFLD